ncbi:CoF synthetase [Pricia sp. S334]|uniref:CoF synthetase n=1 Tax=Pricia mediterranea TaxID=3076079 RepID=A0ABU3L6H1_9FLAO|nr:CoF synthetase [Pricia sp. S334]MDT7829340.1 CoF synthetase [Pricia sp. S334]
MKKGSFIKTRLEKLRNRLYWGFDALKGGRTKAHYDDIRFILENYGSEESNNRRDRHLGDLLDHAVKTTDFYREFSGYGNLQDFPILNKSVIRENYPSIQSSAFRGKDNFKMSTSGSSGTPFTTLQNKDKKRRNTADAIYLKQQAGFEIGYRLYYVRKWFKMHRRSWLTTEMRNIDMVNVTEFSDAYLSDLISTLERDKSTKAILAYSSALRDICKYLDKIGSGQVNTEISCIIAMAEGLSDTTRKALKKFFDAPVLLRYSNMENGILSLQLSEVNNHLQINWASYFVEILHPDKDIPVKEGELGRVVVTDLFNYCMPFIRYDTGDLARMVPDSVFNAAPAFSKVEGRTMDALYDTKGNIQSSFIIFHLESYPEIKQFQFIQEGKKQYTLKLNLERPFRHGKQVLELLKGYLGNDAEIVITYENEIPQLASGKRRLIINNYKKKMKSKNRQTSSQT